MTSQAPITKIHYTLSANHKRDSELSVKQYLECYARKTIKETKSSLQQRSHT